MTDSNPPRDSAGSPRAPAPAPDPGQSTGSLARYLELNRGRFTEEVLARAARDAGYPDAAIEQALAEARARAAAAAPVRARATRIVVAAYLITYGLLVAGMFSSGYARQYGGHIIGSVILAFLLLLGLLISRAFLRAVGRRSGDATIGMATLLSVPVVLLVVVAGVCVATGYPIPRPY